MAGELLVGEACGEDSDGNRGDDDDIEDIHKVLFGFRLNR